MLFANGHVNLPGSGSVPIEGGPAWIDSERYRIDAKAEGPQNQGTMHGPMLQELFEDRFKPKIHRETREVPVYAVTVAKGGLKLPQFKEGSCTPIDFTIFTQFPPPPLPELPPGQKYCPNLGTMKGPKVTVDAQGTSIEEFSKVFLSSLDRPVINKTGVVGLFDFHLEYTPDEPSFQPRGGDSADPAGPSIFIALQQQLGLKLEPAKGPANSWSSITSRGPRETNRGGGKWAILGPWADPPLHRGRHTQALGLQPEVLTRARVPRDRYRPAG
ncbi:MAG TPA: TIGR03435 family protein [Candidatus Acidoferrales bacterium]|nr:TIGR03435 family protein [Candidatus Acidoferrales bacterium]